MIKRSNIKLPALLLALMFVLLPGCAETGTAEISEDVYAAAGGRADRGYTRPVYC